MHEKSKKIEIVEERHYKKLGYLLSRYATPAIFRQERKKGESHDIDKGRPTK